MNKASINRISNKNVLKSLFSFLKYKQILKLVRNNKGLQKRIDINLNNYKEISEFPKYEYFNSVEIAKKRKKASTGLDWAYMFLNMIISCITCIFFTYLLIYSILLVTEGNFGESNSKENFNISTANIIKKINAYIFILDAVTLATPFLYLFFIYVNYEFDYGVKKFIKYIIVIIINIVHLSFEGLIIWKLALSYNIKKGDITWFMRMDYTFIFLNFFYMIYIGFLSYAYFVDSGRNIETITEIKLISFNGIKINEYALPKNFMKWAKKERKKYVLNNYTNYTYNFTSSQYDLINSINNFRQQENLLKLRVDNKIPEFIVNWPVELMLNSEQNFFKLSNKNFLFKFYNEKFEENFEKKDQSIINILSKDNLNHINIISQGEYEFVFIYDKFYFNSYYNKYNEYYSNDIFGNNVDEDYQRFNFSDYRDIIKRNYKKYNE
jgi:hypothetical protein